LLGALAGWTSSRACTGSELLISEFLASNQSSIVDEDGDHSDWIEIYNPCTPDVDLNGWYLTDDPSALTRWRFPSVHLKRGEFLTVFASGKDRAVPGSFLHTSFRLASEGEYLALVKPDGTTIAHAFSPQYPPQVADVSYGLSQSTLTPVTGGSAVSYHVPTSADAPLGTGWTAPSFPDASWSSGTTGLGFASTAPGFDVTVYRANVTVSDLATAQAIVDDPGLRLSTATEKRSVLNYLNTGGSAHFDGDLPFPGMPIGTYVDNFVVVATGTVVIPTAGPWTFGVSSDDGFELSLTREPEELSVSFPSPRAPGDTFAVFNIPSPGAYQVRLVFYELGGGAELELFAAQGSHSSFTSEFHLVGDAASGGLAVSALGAWIGTDVSAPMWNVCSSLWTRARFDVPTASQWALADLRTAYEDGFVAYLNGGEIARRNAPTTVQWNSAAATDRPVEDAGVLEDIDVTDSAGLLASGTNVLAVQGLNESVSGADFLLYPELRLAAATTASSPARYFSAPSPGAYNSDGYASVAPDVTFSRSSGLFTDPFDLTITAPSGVIRYTLDGTDPTETTGFPYLGALTISDSTRIRARVFLTGAAQRPAAGRLFVQIGSDVRTFGSNLPIVVVDTFGDGIAEDWLAENLTAVIPTTAGRASIVDPPEFAGRAGIKLRGSSSLSFPKKQYALETWDENREDVDVSFLGLPAESDWILNGPYNDKTLLRNVLAYQWSNAIGRYAVRTRLVEMYLRTSSGPVSAGDYLGVYVLMEKIKRGPDRVNITRLYASDAVPPAVTGGYIFKKDRLDPGDSGFVISSGQVLAYVEPKESEITPAQAAYVQGFFGDFESALNGPSFADPDVGYAKYIDADSFIDHHILVEMTKNIDGFRLSTFMFKDRDGKLNMGPIWDYDLSQGNANYNDGWLTTGWYHDLLSDYDYPWWRRLFEDPNFRVRYADRWFALRQGPLATATLLANIDANADLLEESQARNFVRWPVLGTYVWPNYFIGTTYESEVDWMKDWIAGRVAWIDSQMMAPPAFNHAPGTIPFGFALTITSPTGTVYYTLDGSDPRLPGGAVSGTALVYSAPFVLTASTHIRARALASGEWSALADATFDPLRLALLNEVQPVNGNGVADEAGDHDPWIELYNPAPTTVELSGLFLTDDPAQPHKWSFPASTELCGTSWLLVWADGEISEGPLHASFSLSPSGGTVWIYTTSGVLVDSLAYGPVPATFSFGRSPDGGPSLVQFSHATPARSNGSASTRVLLNEYNGVSPNKFLSGSDTFWGHVLGNGGDWFELVVVEDHLDMRGFSVEVDDNSGASVSTLVFSQSSVLSDLRSGTILTVGEDLASNVSYNPAGGDWWIHLRAGSAGDGLYVSNTPFDVSNQNTQITIRDALGQVAFGPAGEGIHPTSGVGNDEVLKLEENPGPDTTPFSSYADGSSSTFGSPNLWNSGTSQQDFTALRLPVTGSCGVSSDCNDGNSCTADACVTGHCQNTPITGSCDDGNPCTSGDHCSATLCVGTAVPACCVSACDCDDGSACTVDSCTGNVCTHQAIPSGSACDDGDACTVGDTCQAGACSSTAISCNDNDACTSDSCGGGICTHGASGACGFAGTVRYYRDGAASVEPSGKPVGTVGIDSNQDFTANAITGTSGTYAIGNLFGAVSISTLPKFGSPRAADHNGAITSLDASLISAHAVGSVTLSASQRIAADVTGDGSISALDASKVAQFSVELIDHFDAATASGSDWRFLRCDHYTSATQQDCGTPSFTVNPLVGTQTGDFYAVLLGDVTGNWQGVSGLAPAETDEGSLGAPGRAAAATLRASAPATQRTAPSGPARLSISGWPGRLAKGARIDVLLNLQNADGIEAVDLLLRYDAKRLAVVGVAAGSLSPELAVASHASDGAEKIAAYGTVPLQGSGAFLTVTLEALEDFASARPFAVEARANEGRLPLGVGTVPKPSPSKPSR
jgi:hypothetical protein